MVFASITKCPCPRQKKILNGINDTISLWPITNTLQSQGAALICVWGNNKRDIRYRSSVTRFKINRNAIKHQTSTLAVFDAYKVRSVKCDHKIDRNMTLSAILSVPATLLQFPPNDKFPNVQYETAIQVRYSKSANCAHFVRLKVNGDLAIIYGLHILQLKQAAIKRQKNVVAATNITRMFKRENIPSHTLSKFQYSFLNFSKFVHLDSNGVVKTMEDTLDEWMKHTWHVEVPRDAMQLKWEYVFFDVISRFGP